MGTTAHHIYTGIDHDIIPPCRSADGTEFRIKFQVSNRLDQNHAWKKVNMFGEKPDRELIYNQAGHALKEVCARKKSKAIAQTEFHLLDVDILEEMKNKMHEVIIRT